MFNFVDYIEDQINFSAKTFGPGARTEAVLAHIRKELIEVENKPTDITEWADVIILTIEGAWRVGFTSEEIAKALVQKLEKNKRRKWPDWRTTKPGQPIEHIREGEEKTNG